MASSQPIPTHHNFQDLTGQTFRGWLVLEYAGRDKKYNSLWLCRRKDGITRIRRQCFIVRKAPPPRGDVLQAASSGPQREQLLEHIRGSVAIKENGCWEWTKARDRDGYGRCYYRGYNMGSHQLSFLVHHGPIDDGLLVCHTCDNPPCCNPEHLFCGTRRDNTQDMMRKGRFYLKRQTARAEFPNGVQRE